MNKNQGTGSTKSKKDLRDYKIKILKDAVLPSKYEVYHCPVKDQGEVDSCVPFVLTEILETRYGKSYSTNWIYGYRENSYNKDNEGMCINIAIGTIYDVGYLTYDELPGNDEMPKAREIVEKDLEHYKELASKRKINAYARLEKINEVKQAIYNGGLPVAMCVDIIVDKKKLPLDKNYVAILPTEEDKTVNHAMLCYGWNETGFLIQNSWGEEWGNKGTCILPYSYLFTEAWVIEPKNRINDLQIVKPNLYWLRELIMLIIKLIRNLQK